METPNKNTVMWVLVLPLLLTSQEMTMESLFPASGSAGKMQKTSGLEQTITILSYSLVSLWPPRTTPTLGVKWRKENILIWQVITEQCLGSLSSDTCLYPVGS